MHALTLRSLRVGNIGDDLPVADYIRSTLARGLPEFAPAIAFNDGTFVIVGSGPSVTSFIDDIRAERSNGRTICAVKGTHDLLIANGIEPDSFVSCEPRERPFKSTSARCTYLLASRCSPALFDQVTGDGRNVVVWHAVSSQPVDVPPPEPGETIHWDQMHLTEECEVWRGRFGVGGGTTSGLRAIFLGFLMGFRKFKLYGFDSCLAPDRHTKRFSGENIGTSKLMDIIVGGKRFYCNGALAQQATEFQEMYKTLPNITIEAVGDGLIAEILKVRRARGYAS